MFNKQQKLSIEKLDEHIARLTEKAKTPEDIAELLTLMERRNELKGKFRISPDTAAVVAGNLLGIALILGHEKANVITTKALSLILRGRV